MCEAQQIEDVGQDESVKSVSECFKRAFRVKNIQVKENAAVGWVGSLHPWERRPCFHISVFEERDYRCDVQLLAGECSGFNQEWSCRY